MTDPDRHEQCPICAVRSYPEESAWAAVVRHYGLEGETKAAFAAAVLEAFEQPPVSLHVLIEFYHRWRAQRRVA